MLNGILLVDKPAGWTSHDAVAKVRGIIRRETRDKQQGTWLHVSSSKSPVSSGSKIRIGHTGTLDPMATGLLILVIGNYTKRAGEFSKLDKVYEAELTLGATSTTGDKEGTITPTLNHNLEYSRRSSDLLQRITEAVKSFEGQIWQKPPAFSAVKIGGQRAYKLARKGQKFELEPRKATIYEISVLSYEYPKLRLKTQVSSGTYIRSLAEDIGDKLGTGAYLSALRRTQVGHFQVKSALKIEDISADLIYSHLQTPA